MARPRKPRHAVCQRSGLEYPEREIVREERTGLRVHISHLDPEHPREHMHYFIKREKERLGFVNPPLNNNTSEINPAWEFSDMTNFFDTTRFST